MNLKANLIYITVVLLKVLFRFIYLPTFFILHSTVVLLKGLQKGQRNRIIAVIYISTVVLLKEKAEKKDPESR